MVKDGRCATIRCVPPCSVSRRPRALLIALAHPFNQSWNPAPAPGPYLLSHQTDPGDPILEFSIQHFLCARASEGRQGQGQGKGKASRHRASIERRGRRASPSSRRRRRAGGRHEGGPKPERESAAALGTRARTSSFDETRTRTTTKVTVAREDDGEVRLGSEPDELEGSRKKS